MDSMPRVGPDSLVRFRRAARRPRWHGVVLDPDSTTARHYWREADRPDRLWARGEAISDQATGPGSLWVMRGQLWAVIPTSEGPLKYRWSDKGRWMRGEPHSAGGPRAAMDRLVDREGTILHVRDGRTKSCLRVCDPEPFDRVPDAVRVAQLSGERDAVTGEATRSRSVSSAGVLGTDLGVRVELEGRSFLLCGDTHWAGRPWLATRDAIAEVGQGELPQIRFHGSPLRLIGQRTTMGEYDVPLDGFDWRGRSYLFFSSNHFAAGQVMGRSVLARAREQHWQIDPAARRRPLEFEAMRTFSSEKFINVSLHREGSTLWVWGSGCFRASDLHLARIDLAAPGWPVSYRSAAGWSDRESAAAPVRRGAYGELSVRWIPELKRYLLLSSTGPEDPAGAAVVLRTARQAWGPWSRRLVLLDWVRQGRHADPAVRFLKASPDDPISDRIFPAQAGSLGAGYAPYLFDVTLCEDQIRVRFTFSTWNPYQIQLMENRFDRDVLMALETR